MSTAGALAVALPVAGLIIAVVLATWRVAWNGLTSRLDEHAQRLGAIERQQGEILRALGQLDEHGQRLGAIEVQQGEILRALGRLEGRRDAEDEAAA